MRKLGAGIDLTKHHDFSNDVVMLADHKKRTAPLNAAHVMTATTANNWRAK